MARKSKNEEPRTAPQLTFTEAEVKRQAEIYNFYYKFAKFDGVSLQSATKGFHQKMLADWCAHIKKCEDYIFELRDTE